MKTFQILSHKNHRLPKVHKKSPKSKNDLGLNFDFSMGVLAFCPLNLWWATILPTQLKGLNNRVDYLISLLPTLSMLRLACYGRLIQSSTIRIKVT